MIVIEVEPLFAFVPFVIGIKIKPRIISKVIGRPALKIKIRINITTFEQTECGQQK